MKKTNNLTKLLTCSALGLSMVGKPAQAGRVDLGGAIGYVSGNVKSQSRFNALGNNPSSSILGGNSLSGQLFASWEMSAGDNLYLGAEVTGDFSNADFEQKRSIINNSHTFKISYRHALDVAFKLGYRINKETSLYLKAGLSLAKWEIKSSLGGGHLKSKKKNLLGFRPAIGVRTDLTESASASLEYSHGIYKDLNLKVNGTGEFKTTPRVGALMARFSYKI